MILIPPYIFYMAEQEGFINTKQSIPVSYETIEKIVRYNYMRGEYTPTDLEYWCDTLGINQDRLTKEEKCIIGDFIIKAKKSLKT